MKSLKEQIADKCIHFNGVMNTTCKADIKYADVRVDKPYKFPCLKQGGECPHAKFRTEEEVNEYLKRIEEDDRKVVGALVAVREHFAKTKERVGKIPCQCGGELQFTVATINNHIWAKCNTCKISFNE